MNALKELDEIEQISDKEETPDPTSDVATKTRPLELRRRSTKWREYWHPDIVPLRNTWNHMKYALVIVNDFTGVLCVSHQGLNPLRGCCGSQGAFPPAIANVDTNQGYQLLNQSNGSVIKQRD